MFVVQKRDKETAQWKTCTYKGKKCRFVDIAKAKTVFLLQKNSADGKKHPERQYRILDTLTGCEA